MYISNFCTFCKFTLDIAKSNTNIDKYTDDAIINKILNKEPLTVVVNSKQIHSIKQSDEYKKLSKDQQNAISTKLDDSGVIIMCNNCGWSDSLVPGTILSTQHISAHQTGTNVVMDQSTNEYLINDKTLPRTKNFKCINKDCTSKLGDEAVLVKQKNSNTIMYICCTCKLAF